VIAALRGHQRRAAAALGCLLAAGLAACDLPDGRGTGAPPGTQAMRPGASVLAEREVDRLIGLSREAVLAMLGPSTFTRRDGPAEILRYATDDCFLTLFLHRGDQPRGGTLTVHHVDANPRSRAASGWVNARTCYGQVLELRGIPVREG
jgi:hypothetical protein